MNEFDHREGAVGLTGKRQPAPRRCTFNIYTHDSLEGIIYWKF